MPYRPMFVLAMMVGAVSSAAQISHAQPTTLTLTPDRDCVTVGQQLSVTVSMSAAPINVCVGQFFLSYDNVSLKYLNLVPAPGTAFSTPFGPDVNAIKGTIDYAFAPPFGSCDGASAGPEDIAIITFEVLDTCSPTLVFREDPQPAPVTKLADVNSQTIFPEVVDLPYVRVDDGFSLQAVCPADVLVEADPGMTGAIIQWEGVNDACGIDLPNVNCVPASGSFFPLGTTTVACDTMGPCGETASCVFDVEVLPDTSQPFIVHRRGRIGETRPYSGYVDPRSESSNGVALNLGLNRVVLHFSEPVRALGGGPLGSNSFSIETTGGNVPSIASINADANPRIVIMLEESPRPPLGEWTTIRAIVEDLVGNPILNEGALGPGIAEPDRLDFGLLPGDVTGNGVVQPADLIAFRSMLNGAPPEAGVRHDFLDADRNDFIGPADLIRFRQLLAGTSPATQTWLQQAMHHDQP